MCSGSSNLPSDWYNVCVVRRSQHPRAYVQTNGHHIIFTWPIYLLSSRLLLSHACLRFNTARLVRRHKALLYVSPVRVSPADHPHLHAIFYPFKKNKHVIFHLYQFFPPSSARAGAGAYRILVVMGMRRSTLEPDLCKFDQVTFTEIEASSSMIC